MTSTEQTYITAFQNVLRAVSNVNLYVSSALADQVDYLEAQIGDEARIEQLREMAWR